MSGASAGEGFFGYAVGYKEGENRDGTWRDAEDGQLSGNAVAQGAVDSTVSFRLDIPPHGYVLVHYWIACGKNLNEAATLDSQVKHVGVEQMLLEVENYWSAWFNRLKIDLNILPREVARAIYREKIEILFLLLKFYSAFVTDILPVAFH